MLSMQQGKLHLLSLFSCIWSSLASDQCQYSKTISGQTFSQPSSDTLNVTATVKLQMPDISLSSLGVGLVWGPREAEIIRGHNFTLTCCIPGEVRQGQFFLIFSGNSTRIKRSAVNNLASFTFPVAEFEHQGNYSCVYQVNSSSLTFTSPESAFITVVVKESLLLILLISGGISLLLLFILLLVCLVKRRKKLRNSMDLSHAERAPRESGGDYEDDYENIQESCIPANFTNESQEEDNNDYENAILDENIDFPETGSQYRRKCVSSESESQEEEMDEEDGETSDDDNDYENVTAHFNQSVEDEYIDPICDRSTDDPKFELKSQKEHMRVKSKSQAVKIEKEDEDTSDDDNDYVNVTTLSTAV